MPKAARWRSEIVSIDPVNGTEIFFPKDLFVRRVEIEPLGEEAVRFRSNSDAPRSEQQIFPARPLSLDFGADFFVKGDTGYLGTIWSLRGVQKVVLRWFT